MLRVKDQRFHVIVEILCRTVASGLQLLTELLGIGNRLEAEAILDENIEAQIHMLDNYPSLKSMYTPGDGNTEVYFLQNVTAAICSFTAEPEVYEF